MSVCYDYRKREFHSASNIIETVQRQRFLKWYIVMETANNFVGTFHEFGGIYFAVKE